MVTLMMDDCFRYLDVPHSKIYTDDLIAKIAVKGTDQADFLV